MFGTTNFTLILNMHGTTFDIFMRHVKSFIINCMQESLSKQNLLVVLSK